MTSIGNFREIQKIDEHDIIYVSGLAARGGKVKTKKKKKVFVDNTVILTAIVIMSILAFFMILIAICSFLMLRDMKKTMAGANWFKSCIQYVGELGIKIN